jgi:hypothetical protein
MSYHMHGDGVICSYLLHPWEYFSLCIVSDALFEFSLCPTGRVLVRMSGSHLGCGSGAAYSGVQDEK